MAKQSYPQQSYPQQMGTPQPYGYPMYGSMGAGMNNMPAAMNGMYGGGAMPGAMNGMQGAYGVAPSMPSGSMIPGTMPTQVAGQAFEESYIENILRLNLGKIATIYMTFENNPQWNAKVFKGKLEAAGRDHIIISDPKTGVRYLLLMVNLDYITFDEQLQYAYPLQPGSTPTGR
jgi:spore germination protein Q